MKLPKMKTREQARNAVKQIKFITQTDVLMVGEKQADGWPVKFKGGTLKLPVQQAVQ